MAKDFIPPLNIFVDSSNNKPNECNKLSTNTDINVFLYQNSEKDKNNNCTNIDEYMKLLSNKSIINIDDISGLIIIISNNNHANYFGDDYEKLTNIFNLLAYKINQNKNIGISYNEFKDFIIDNLDKTQGLTDKFLTLLPSIFDSKIIEAKEKEAELDQFKNTIFAYDK